MPIIIADDEIGAVTEAVRSRMTLLSNLIMNGGTRPLAQSTYESYWREHRSLANINQRLAGHMPSTNDGLVTGAGDAAASKVDGDVGFG